MFDDCTSFTSLDLSNFNTNKVENMDFMFYNCSSLNYLDITNFNSMKVKNMYKMFSGINKKCKIINIYIDKKFTDNCYIF